MIDFHDYYFEYNVSLFFSKVLATLLYTIDQKLVMITVIQNKIEEYTEFLW